MQNKIGIKGIHQIQIKSGCGIVAIGCAVVGRYNCEDHSVASIGWGCGGSFGQHKIRFSHAGRDCGRTGIQSSIDIQIKAVVQRCVVLIANNIHSHGIKFNHQKFLIGIPIVVLDLTEFDIKVCAIAIGVIV